MTPTETRYVCPLCDVIVVTTKWEGPLSIPVTETLLREHMMEKHRVPSFRIIPILEAMQLRSELERRKAIVRESMLLEMDGST